MTQFTPIRTNVDTKLIRTNIITKRERFSEAALIALLSNEFNSGWEDKDYREITKTAVRLADHLIRELSL